jgi:hypothetical protein
MSNKDLNLNWEMVALSGVDVNLPGILEWQIEGVGSYIVKSNMMRRRYMQYEQNVRNLNAGLPHEAGRPDYRRIHHLLNDALLDGRKVRVLALENCSTADLPVRKRYWIERNGTLNQAT